MTVRTWLRALWIPAALGLLVGCPGESVSTDPAPSAPARVEKKVYPDPPEAASRRVTDVVRQFVVEHAGEDGVFDIPPRGGRDVAGTLGEFHTVHQNDADTYTVCVDFHQGDDVYDVDFFVDRKADGLKVRSPYLHKVNGEVVPG